MAIKSWFEHTKGFIYKPQTKEYLECNNAEFIQGDVSACPRIRKRTGSSSPSDIRQIPGLIFDDSLGLDPTFLYEGKHVFMLKSPLTCETRGVESLINTMLNGVVDNSKSLVLDFEKVENYTGNVFSMEDIVTIVADINPLSIHEDYDASKVILPKSVSGGYTGEDDMMVDLKVYAALVDAGFTPGQINKYFSDNLSTARLGYLPQSIHTPAQSSNSQPEYLFNGVDGVYLATLKKDKYENTRLSNFTIHPTHSVLINNDETVHCSIHIEGNKTESISCQFGKADLMGWKEFIRSIPSSRVLWLGKDKEVQLLRGWIQQSNIPQKKGVDKIGFYKDRFILVDGSVKEGRYIKDDDHVYADPYTPSIHEVEGQVTSFEAYATPILRDCTKINEPNSSAIVVSWFLMSILSDFFRKVNGNFPILQLWGTRGSGKTTLAAEIAKVFGNVGEPKSCNRTPFSLLRDMSSSNAVPVVMDEYKPSEIPTQRLDSLHYSLRMAYNGMQDTRGRADFTVQSFTLTTPVVISGESPFIDPAIVERSIIINLRPQYVKAHPESEIAYNRLLETDTKPFLVEYLKWITEQGDAWIDELIRDSLKKAKSYNAPLRVIQNLSVVIAGLRILKQITDDPIEEDTIVEGCLHTILDESVTSSLDRFMGHLNDMILKNYILIDRDYTVRDGKLSFATDSVIASFSQYCNVHGMRSEMTDRESIRQMLLESRDSGGYAVEAYGKVQKMGNGRSVRCTVIDLEALEKTTDINAESWHIDKDLDIMV